MKDSFTQALQEFAGKHDAVANEKLLPLFGKMARPGMYPLQAGGKRLRPFLLWLIGHAYQQDAQTLLEIGLALELIHTYSLVHDDLPAMDNAALRRNKPTTHIVFGEAQAILIGDGLLTTAFEILADVKIPCPTITLKIIKTIAQNVGMCGMIKGQWIDLLPPQQDTDLQDLVHKHQLKTGALIQVTCLIAPMMAQAPENEMEVWSNIADKIGLAFQITDDLLDQCGTVDQTGKDHHADEGKQTFLSYLGAHQAREHANNLVYQAHEILNALSLPSSQALLLHQFIDYTVERTR